jgi:hypothetical protein
LNLPLAGGTLGAVSTTRVSTYVAVVAVDVVNVLVVLVVSVGDAVGANEGTAVGREVGAVVGVADGAAVGTVERATVGTDVGALGDDVGIPVGAAVGITVGLVVGKVDGCSVGGSVGTGVGAKVVGTAIAIVLLTIHVLGVPTSHVYMYKRGLMMVPQSTPTVLRSSVSVPLFAVRFTCVVYKSVLLPPAINVPRR